MLIVIWTSEKSGTSLVFWPHDKKTPNPVAKHIFALTIMNLNIGMSLCLKVIPLKLL